ncbi:FGGY family carbohydrate kinase [Streptomyces sp. NPDC057638]|uniref:FGGY family carbohydrate kinase n=1 Tax=Streptomyces sp. NPDC057638 TaxID=3346190 RepID=UPI0036D16716
MYLGIDVGTSVVKAAAFDPQGQPLHLAARPLTLHLDDGRVEQDMDEVHDAVLAVLAEVRAGLSAPVVLAGLTGQGDGVWLVDGVGRPVRAAISWMDGRAHELVADWHASGLVERVFRRTGGAMFPGSPGPLLAWLERFEPQALEAASAAVYCKDMVFQRLTGIRATDVSDASMPFLDPRSRTYDAVVLDALGLGHRAALLPPVSDPVATGELEPGVPLANGPYDLAACALGAGVSAPGDGLLIVGTCLAALVAVDALDLDGEPAGLHISTDRHGRWLRAMPAMVGTAALDWVLRTTGVPHGELDAVLAASPPGARGVRVLPYFAPSGERAPFVEPRLRAELTGVSLETTTADLVRATCEGVAFAARDCLEAARLGGTLAVCGGGARSAEWVRLFADVLGRPLRIVAGEVGARGAVLAAAARLGLPLDQGIWTAPDRLVEPDPDRSSYYAEAYADHRARLSAARARL